MTIEFVLGDCYKMGLSWYVGGKDKVYTVHIMLQMA